MIRPFENNTEAFIKRLAKRSMQSERRRNAMVVISVALAAFLISFAGSTAVSLVQMQNNQISDTYEAVYSNLTETDMEALKEQPGIERAGGYYLIGEEQSVQGFKGSFIYADETMMYTGRNQMEIVDGELPEEANEIMVSRNWLKKFAPEAGIGDCIALGTESFPGEYRISGLMDLANVENSEIYGFIVSKAQLVQLPGYNPSGFRAYVHLKNVQEMDEEEIKGYCEKIAEKYGLSAPTYYSLFFSRTFGSVDFGTTAVLGVLAAVVLTGGCVVIQSIFRISIHDKIQSFGQLRTLGATKKQIMRMVKKEGRRLGWLGIFAGTAPGIIIPVFLVPKGLHIAGYLMALAATVLICRGMVALSIKKPVRMAANISPMEAVRIASVQKGFSHRRRKRQKLNPLTLGNMNFRRDKMKTVSITISLSIGGILLLCASTLLLTYEPEALAGKYFPNGHYKVYTDSEEELSKILYSGNPLSEELRQEILAVEGVEDVITARKSVGTDYKAGSYTGGGMGDMITPDNCQALEKGLTQGHMPEGKKGILLPDHVGVEVGTAVELSLGGSTVEVTVDGLFDITKVSAGYGHGKYQFDGAMLYLPEELFQELLPGVGNFDYSWDIVSDPAMDSAVKMALQEILDSHTGIGLDTFSDYVEYCRSTNSVVFHIMQGIALLISLFGIINLINTTLSNLMSRKWENSVLRSVGLTKKQLYQMITVEGVGYVLLCVLLTALLGLPLSFVLHHEISAAVYGSPTAFRFPFFYMALYFLLLMAIQFLLSLWSIRKQGKQSMIEQLRKLD